jgi:hypothetical protein
MIKESTGVFLKHLTHYIFQCTGSALDMSSVVKVQVTHNKNVHIVELDTDESVDVFRMQLFSLTSVPPEKQKIIGFKGGVLRDDADFSKMDVKEVRACFFWSCGNMKIDVGIALTKQLLQHRKKNKSLKVTKNAHCFVPLLH